MSIPVINLMKLDIRKECSSLKLANNARFAMEAIERHEQDDIDSPALNNTTESLEARAVFTWPFNFPIG